MLPAATVTLRGIGSGFKLAIRTQLPVTHSVTRMRRRGGTRRGSRPAMATSRVTAALSESPPAAPEQPTMTRDRSVPTATGPPHCGTRPLRAGSWDARPVTVGVALRPAAGGRPGRHGAVLLLSMGARARVRHGGPRRAEGGWAASPSRLTPVSSSAVAVAQDLICQSVPKPDWDTASTASES